jgi:dTDP-4-dehydrorhamnose reductase
MRILVLGANGQLGSDILRLWRDPAVAVLAATRADADVTVSEAVRTLFERARPDVVVNTTAFHNLPACEAEPAEAFRVNAIGARNVAAAARDAGASVVQLSTDYVFDGEKGAPYLEGDARRSLNAYGATRIAGEDMVAQANPEHAIVRVAGLYGLAGSAGKGGNFVETMLRLAHEGKPIRVVADQLTAPTNTAEVAEALLPLLKAGGRGTFHLAPADCCSWAEFAAAIFEACGLEPDFAPITSAEFGGPVRRPAYSVLASIRAPALRPWRDGLIRYLREKGDLARPASVERA